MSINAGAIEPWTKPHYRASLVDMKREARRRGVSLDVPWRALPEADRRWIVDGDEAFEGIAGFFRQLETEEIQGARPGVPESLPRLPGVQGLWGNALAVRGEAGRGRRPDDRRRLGA